VATRRWKKIDMFIRFDTTHERDRHTDTHTDTAWRHRPRLCIALRGKNYDNILSRFHLIPERCGRTDRRTDRFAISISRVNMLTRDKNAWSWLHTHVRYSHNPITNPFDCVNITMWISRIREGDKNLCAAAAKNPLITVRQMLYRKYHTMLYLVTLR